MIKITDPTYADQYFVVDGGCVYTTDKKDVGNLLIAIEEENERELEKYRFPLSNLDEEEQHFHVIFDKLNTPLIRLLFHE